MISDPLLPTDAVTLKHALVAASENGQHYQAWEETVRGRDRLSGGPRLKPKCAWAPRGGSRNHNPDLLRVNTFSFPRIDRCRDVIVFMARGHHKVREPCIRIQGAIDLLVRPA